MRNKHHVKERIRLLFQTQKLAVLSTDDKGQPYSSLVAFAGSQDLKRILFATARTTRKFANIVNNRRVALMINNSVNQEADFHHAMAVTVTGRAIELTGSEKIRYQEVYLKKHPYLQDFVSAPTCAMVCIRPAHYYLVENFQTVTELHLKPI